jgi:hypothetical protein
MQLGISTWIEDGRLFDSTGRGMQATYDPEQDRTFIQSMPIPEQPAWVLLLPGMPFLLLCRCQLAVPA